MKKRVLCRVCLLTCGIFFLLYVAGGARFFRALQPSMCEKRLEEGQQAAVKGWVCKKIVKETAVVLYLEKLLVQETVRKEGTEDRAVWESEERLMVTLAEGAQIPAIGQEVTVTGTICFFRGAPNPGNFDQKFYYQKQGIHAKLEDAVLLSAAGRGGLREMLWQLKEASAGLICRYLAPEEAGVLCAMLLGEKRFLEEEIQELYQKSGIGHLLATSGLHASFLGLGLYEILRRLRCPVKMSAVAGGIFLTVYVVMTGGSVSAVRACVMFLVRMGAVVTGREYDGLTALSLVGILALFGNPLQMFDAGFLLSYGAVLGIYGIMLLRGKRKSQLENGQKNVRKNVRVQKGMDALRVSLAVQAVILPVLLYYYFEISFYSILWNLAAIPAAGSVMGSGILGLLGGAAATAGEAAGEAFTGAAAGGVLSGAAALCRKLAELCFGISGGILNLYEAGSRILLELPGARLVTGRPQWTQIVFYYLAVGAFLLVRYRGSVRLKNRRVCAPLQGVFLVAALAVLLCPLRRQGQVEVTMLDVGQGDCFFIRGPKGGAYLLDGGSSSVGKVGKYRLEPYLKSQGAGMLDAVWVTHGDEDHLSGIRELLLRQKLGVKIRRLVLPGEAYWDEKLTELARTAREQGVPVFVMEPGDVYKEGMMSLTCLWPGKMRTGETENGGAETKTAKTETAGTETAESGTAAGSSEAAGSGQAGNESSLVLSLHYGAFDMLFTGDLEKDAEEAVAELLAEEQKRGAAPAAYDVLKAGHHGSKNATGESLLETIRPSCAFLSAGKGNRYGHPHEETLERLAKWNVSLYNTKDRSAVKLYTDGKKYCILRP